MPLSRHSAGTYPEMSLHTTSHGTFGQSSQLTKPLWTGPGIKRGISVHELFSISEKKKKAQAGAGNVCSSGRLLQRIVSMGLPSCAGDVAVYVFDINQPSLPTSFYSVIVSVSVFMALSTVFHSINSPDNSPLFVFFFLTVLLVLFLPYWSFQLYISL